MTSPRVTCPYGCQYQYCSGLCRDHNDSNGHYIYCNQSIYPLTHSYYQYSYQCQYEVPLKLTVKCVSLIIHRSLMSVASNSTSCSIGGWLIHYLKRIKRIIGFHNVSCHDIVDDEHEHATQHEKKYDRMLRHVGDVAEESYSHVMALLVYEKLPKLVFTLEMSEGKSCHGLTHVNMP